MPECKYCGQEFIMPKGIVNKLYCSSLCRRRIRTEKGRSNTVDRKCKTCGKTISYKERKDKIYCSKKCKAKISCKSKLKFANEKETILEFAKAKKHLLGNEEGITSIKLSDGEVLIDKRIIPCLENRSVFISTSGYAVVAYGGRNVAIHRLTYLLIKGTLSSPNEPLDHINQNKLDNRLDNLRLTTTSKNGANKKLRPNKSGYRGVYPHLDKWIAQISIEGKVKALGRFSTKKEAALTYNQAAITLWGNDAEVNQLIT